MSIKSRFIELTKQYLNKNGTVRMFDKYHNFIVDIFSTTLWNWGVKHTYQICNANFYGIAEVDLVTFAWVDEQGEIEQYSFYIEDFAE